VTNDNPFDDAAMRLLERTEKKINKRKEAAIEVPLPDQVVMRLTKAVNDEPHRRDLHQLSEAILFLAQVGKTERLAEDVIVFLVVIFKDHFAETVLISNALYAVACIARTTIIFFEHLWGVTVKCVVAAIRFHQLDPLVNSNGLFAMGKVCEQSFRLQELVAKTEGVDTILGSMRIHDLDQVVQCNGCLAIARLLDAQPPPEPSINPEDEFRQLEEEDPDQPPRDTEGWRRSAAKNALKVQEQAVRAGVVEVLKDAYQNHIDDEVLLQDLCEAVGCLSAGNLFLTREELRFFAEQMRIFMKRDFHDILYVRNKMPVPPEEQHGRDDLVVAMACRALARMSQVKSNDLNAGYPGGTPLFVAHPDKQEVLMAEGAVKSICDALHCFPRKKDTVLTEAAKGLATLVKRDYTGLHQMVQYKGVEWIKASVERWYEDEVYSFVVLQTLRTLVEGEDGVRNNWYLETTKGREVAKTVVQGYQAIAKKSSNIDDARIAQVWSRLSGSDAQSLLQGLWKWPDCGCRTERGRCLGSLRRIQPRTARECSWGCQRASRLPNRRRQERRSRALL